MGGVSGAGIKPKVENAAIAPVKVQPQKPADKPPVDTAKIRNGNSEVADIIGVPAEEVASKDIYTKLWNNYEKMGARRPRGYSQAQFTQRVKEAGQDGKITKAELEWVYGMRPSRDSWLGSRMTDEAFYAFTGKRAEAITGENHKEKLLHYMEHYVKYKGMSGIPFSYFARCCNITPVSKRELGEVFRRMSPQKKIAFVRNNRATLDRMFGEKVSDKQIVKNLKKMGKEEQDWLMFLFYWKCHDLITGRKLELTEDVEDDFVARKFARTLFKSYLVEGKGATEEELESLEEFGRKIVGDGSYIGLNGIVGKQALKDIDPTYKGENGLDFKAVLSMVDQYNKAPIQDKNKIKDEIISLLARFMKTEGIPEEVDPDALAAKVEVKSSPQGFQYGPVPPGLSILQ